MSDGLDRRAIGHGSDESFETVIVPHLDAGYRLARFLMPVGEGVIEWPALLAVLPDCTPDGREIMLSVEGILRGRGEMAIPHRDPRWVAGHPDLVTAELDALIAPAGTGKSLDIAELRGPVAKHEPLDFIRHSASALRRHLAGLQRAA